MGITGRQFPIARAALSGATAYLCGYLLTYIWLGSEAAGLVTGVTVRVRPGGPGGMTTEPSLASLTGSPLDPVTWAGWLWANAHFVPIVEWSYPASDVTVPNLVLAGNPSWLGLVLLPPVLLMAAGGIAARRSQHGHVATLPVLRVQLPAGLVRGMAVWIGYLPATVFAAFLFSSPTTNDALSPFAPSLVGAFALAGMAYPIVFGGLGGWWGAWLRAVLSPNARDGPGSTAE